MKKNDGGGKQNNQMRPTEKDIKKTASGFYRLDCDGRHDHSSHFYLYYTKKQVIKMWRDEHPKSGDSK
jgi:hypothetical protein